MIYKYPPQIQQSQSQKDLRPNGGFQVMGTAGFLVEKYPILSHLIIASKRAPQMKQQFPPPKERGNTKIFWDSQTLACKASAFDASKSFTCKDWKMLQP